jgi:hypothetical protein
LTFGGERLFYEAIHVAQAHGSLLSDRSAGAIGSGRLLVFAPLKNSQSSQQCGGRYDIKMFFYNWVYSGNLAKRLIS